MRKLIAILAFLACAPALGNSLLLDTTNHSLELATSAAVSTDWVVSWADHTATTLTPGMSQGNVASAMDTTIAAAPAASTQRQVKWISVRNRSTTTANTVTIQLDVSGTEYAVGPDITLAAGESMRWDAEGGLTVFSSSGVKKQRNVDMQAYNGIALWMYKVGSASEAAGVRYAHAKDSGLPGAWIPGTPGLNGYRTDCSQTDNATDPVGASQMGSFQLADPTSGNYFLTGFDLATNVPNFSTLIDVVWYNTGIVSATTTAQTITLPGAFPARDIYGSSDGVGYEAAIYVTTGGAAAVITGTTLQYTNSDGTGSRTATTWVAASPVAGSFFPFQLQAGDRGIKDISSITLTTSYGAAVVSLVVYRAIATSSNPTANVGGSFGVAQFFNQAGVRIYNDSCFWLSYLSSTTTATNSYATVSIMER